MFRACLVVAALLIQSLPAAAQGTVADYVQAITLRDRYQALAINVPEQVQWIRNTNRFWYRKTVPGGHAFVLVNADTQTKAPAFDHTKLADASGGAYGDHKRYDFFVRHLLALDPPSWPAVDAALKSQAKSTSATSGR